uniref:(northern house mosquito) hypothetical protein n=1 Tax=Culex pipiens TaxID=7175 RepID=A0A8D8CVI0_CULPI
MATGCTGTWCAGWSATSRSPSGRSRCTRSCGSPSIAISQLGNRCAMKRSKLKPDANAGWRSRGSRPRCYAVHRCSATIRPSTTMTPTSACSSGATWPPIVQRWQSWSWGRV